MRTAAVLPVKRFAHAKQRLGAAVSDLRRRELAAAMVEDVLEELAKVDAIELIIAVTSEPAITPAAGARGARVLPDASESGQSAAASLGVRAALGEGMERVLCVAGDCPAVAAGELDALLAASQEQPGVLIIPDRHGSGTNALLLAPPDAIPPSFGPDSCARHRALARAAAVACRVEHVSSLLLDIDTGADLEELRSRLASRPGGAPRTRAVLARAAGPLRPPARASA